MMNVDELESKIKEEKTKLTAIEAMYEKEEDENKQTKMEYRISRLDETIDKLVDRQNALLDKEAKDAEKPNPKDKNLEEEEDTDVCEECGGDLVLLETSDEGDIYECETCGELFLDN